MNFKIVEGSSVEVDFEDFEKDYLNPLITSKELFLKYGLGKNMFWKMCKEVREKHGLLRKPHGKYYSMDKLNKCYNIRRQFNGEQRYYGSIPVGREDLLKEALELCEEHNWENPVCKEKIMELKQ